MTKKWDKTWGFNTELFSNDVCSVNVLNIVKGGTCSLHTHRNNHNQFYIISGKIILLVENRIHWLYPGQFHTVYAGEEHQFSAEEESVVVEIVYVKIDKLDIERKTEGFVKS